MYNIKLSLDANNDINNIAIFIAKESGSIEIAYLYLDKIENTIFSLENYPNRGSNPSNKILRNQGYKFIVVENHLILYKVKNDQKLVIVYRVLHQKSDYKNYL